MSEIPASQDAAENMYRYATNAKLLYLVNQFKKQAQSEMEEARIIEKLVILYRRCCTVEPLMFYL